MKASKKFWSESAAKSAAIEAQSAGHIARIDHNPNDVDFYDGEHGFSYYFLHVWSAEEFAADGF